MVRGGARAKNPLPHRPTEARPAQLRLNQRGPHRRAGSRSPSLGWPAEREPRTGLPYWSLALGAMTAIALLLSTVTGATKWSFALFLGSIVGAAMGVAQMVAGVAQDKTPLRAARAGTLIVLAAALPIVFDPHTGDVFNLPKFTLLVIGALVLAALWVVAAAGRTEVPRWHNGLQWAVGALVAWVLVCALAGVDTHVSLLGNYGSYDGFYAAASFGVLFMVAAESIGPDDARSAISSVLVCAATPIVVYGAIQLHDTEVHGSVWDFINWHTSSFTSDIFSTFGNPNHLGGFLAMALPAMVVFGLGASRIWWRAGAALLTLFALVELVRTSARGAWVATIAAVFVIAVGLAPEVRRHIRLYASVAGAVVVVFAGGMAAGGSRFLSHKLSTLFQSSGGSSVWQRFQIWDAALRMAGNHPLTGVGPDNFALMYPRYQSAAWVHYLGPNYLVNGAHNIFMNFLADEGPIGLALWVLLLALIAARCVKGWRGFRREEVHSPQDAGCQRRRRTTLTVLAASMTAYVVQACFNVQQIGLSEVFWVLAGCTYAVTASAPAEVAQPQPTSRRQPARQYAGWAAPGVAGVLCLAGVVAIGVFAVAPYRADHDYWAAYQSLQQARTAASSQSGAQVTNTFFQDMSKAISLDPAEPTYPLNEALVDNSIAGHATSAATANTALMDARSAALKAVADEPLVGQYPATAAQIDLELAHLQAKAPAMAQFYLASAEHLARQALNDNPRNSQYSALMAQVRTAMKANK